MLPNLLQRYKFESNSQLPLEALKIQISCQISCKDTNLKAIHYAASLLIFIFSVAKSPAKIQIWKQFTTRQAFSSSSSPLPNLLQRYKFESNSQPIDVLFVQGGGCQISCKDTNLKAIHNWRQSFPTVSCVAKSPAKIQIWKQFTTCSASSTLRAALPNLLQRYKFESNSQQQRTRSHAEWRCQISCKDTNLKAIHNYNGKPVYTGAVAKSPAKIQIWKQFTTNFLLRTHTHVVAKSPAKIQIWKQFTTSVSSSFAKSLLPNLLQRYKFESNSQQTRWVVFAR